MEDYILISYLKNQLKSTDKAKVEKWLKASPENITYFKNLKKIWLQAGNIPELASPDINAAWNRFDNTITKRSLRNNYQIIFKAAAAIAIIIGCYFVFRLQLPLWKAEKYIAVSSGDSIKKLILSDSSIVWLNKNSKIFYSNKYNKNRRKIKLEGEAFFEVHHFIDIPFEITTQQASIKDIGTSFNVKSDTLAKKVKVAVVSGKVDFSDIVVPVNEAKLHINQVATLFANHSIKIRNVNTVNENAWLTGQLVFHNQLFSDIAEAIGATYNSKIVFADKKLAEIRITASFNHQSLAEIMNVLSQTTNLNFKITDKVILFYK